LGEAGSPLDGEKAVCGEETAKFECDMCGEPATERVTIEIGPRSFLKDLCYSHAGALLSGARTAREGLRKGAELVTSAAAPTMVSADNLRESMRSQSTSQPPLTTRYSNRRIASRRGQAKGRKGA
jgi:hypothetical protein